jgi:hypothetical protein
MHSVLTCRIILTIRDTAGHHQGTSTELHASYEEPVFASTPLQFVTTPQYSQEQDASALSSRNTQDDSGGLWLWTTTTKAHSLACQQSETIFQGLSKELSLFMYTLWNSIWFVLSTVHRQSHSIRSASYKSAFTQYLYSLFLAHTTSAYQKCSEASIKFKRTLDIFYVFYLFFFYLLSPKLRLTEFRRWCGSHHMRYPFSDRDCRLRNFNRNPSDEAQLLLNKQRHSFKSRGDKRPSPKMTQ